MEVSPTRYYGKSRCEGEGVRLCVLCSEASFESGARKQVRNLCEWWDGVTDCLLLKRLAEYSISKHNKKSLFQTVSICAKRIRT